MARTKKSSSVTSTPLSGTRRRSLRIGSTGKKSSYFEDDVDESDASVRPRKIAKTKGRKKELISDDEVEESQFDESESEGAEDESFDEDEEDIVAKRVAQKRRGRPPKGGRPAGTPKKQAKTKREFKEDSEDLVEDDDDDDDGPQVEFIPLPQLKDTKGIAYEDDRLHPNTMDFLKELKANNKRSWLKMRDPEYRRSLKDWESFVETLTEKIIEADETIPELPLKDVIFRIYRDIRFSKDPTPYKPHYSAAWSRTGRKGPYACYYVHAEPGSCFVGGGLWHPDKDALARLRANIDERPHRIRRVLMDPRFRSTFFPKAKDDEKALLRAFADSNQENALKTRPQGFHPDHRDIELLKLRNYTVGVKIRDEDLTSARAQRKIMDIIGAMVGYVTFLNSVVMPDPNFDSDSSDDEGEDGADEGDEGDDEE